MATYNFVELGIAYLLGIMMPGPSVALIIDSAMFKSSITSIKNSIGVVLGIAVQFWIILMGLEFITKNFYFNTALHVLCSVFLVYLGFRAIIKRSSNQNVCDIKSPINNQKQFTDFYKGFFIELLNPMAFNFFISVTVIILKPQELSFYIKTMYWLEIVILGSLWFFSIAFFASSKKIIEYVRKFSKQLEVISGCIFILFGSRIFINYFL